MKKILSFVLTIVMVAGMIYMPARATETYSGSLEIEGAGWFATQNTTNTSFYAQGTDVYLSNEGEDWTSDARKMQAANTNSGVFIGNIKQANGMLNKIIGNASGFTNIYQITGVEANAGDIITIKGTFTTLDGTAQITFAESKFRWTGTTWEDYVEIASYESALTLEGTGWYGTNANNTGTALYVHGADTYLLEEGEAWGGDDRTLVADNANSGIFFGEERQENARIIKIIGGVEVAGATHIYYISGIQASEGTVLTVKGNFTTADGKVTFNIRESKFAYVDGVWTNYVGATDTKITSLMVDSADYYPTFQEDKRLWYTYFKTDATLLGESWATGESYIMTLSDGTIECNVEAKKAGDNILFVEIPADILAEGASKTLTMKAGDYVNQGNNFRICLTEDFSFSVNPYGWSADASKIISALEQPVIFRLNTTGQWPVNSASGFYLEANVEDGAQADAENWSERLNPLKTSDNTYYTGGVWKGDIQTEVYIIKLSQTAYYVALSDLGYGAAAAGETYTVKGLFQDSTGRVIGYQPITVKWNGASWEQVYTSLVDTKIQHDVNSDMSVDSRDLVRMLRHMDNSSIPINDNQKDINYSGAFNGEDIESLKKVLLGMIYYVDGKVYGTPAYNAKKVIEKMAYVCPDVGTWNEENTVFTPLADTELDTILQKYKAAGLTLLNTEHVAQYQDNAWNAEVNKPIRVYLEAANRNGLGVLVFDSVIQYMLTQKNPAVYGANWQGVIESHIQTLQKYSSFRGFVIWDEMTIEYADTYNQIVSYIREAHPELLLVTSLLPVTVYDQTGDNKGVTALTTNTSASKEEAYRDYVRSYARETGHFIYDLYPLVYSEDKIFGYTYRSEYGIVDDWYLNLQYVANEVKMQNYSFTTGITIQACKLTGWSNNRASYETYAPETIEDIGFQVYTAMAYGMKDINYFAYADHWTDTVVEGGMTEYPLVYNAVSAVNAEIDKFANVYQSFSWKDTLDVAAGTTNSSTGNDRLVSVVVDGARTFVGCMKDADGFDGYMIANASGPREGTSTKVTLTFNDADSAIVYIDGIKNTVKLTDGTYTVTVPSGEGVFVVPLRNTKG